MRLELLNGDYIQADETPLMVQVPGLGRNHRACLWQYSRPGGSVVLDFQMGRGREGPRKFLGNYEGILQTVVSTHLGKTALCHALRSMSTM
jgi:hypothetical protein